MYEYEYLLFLMPMAGGRALAFFLSFSITRMYTSTTEFQILNNVVVRWACVTLCFFRTDTKGVRSAS